MDKIATRRRIQPRKSASKRKSVPKPPPPSYDKTASTPAEYGGLQAAFEHFNRELFGGVLPDCFIVYTRKPHSRGHYGNKRFSARAGNVEDYDEVSLNPDAFIERTDEQICSTLVHEQCHVWQYHHGKPPSRGYHNKEWAATMKAIGLQPSNTGAVGGKETGSQMSHYAIPGGLFAQSFARLATKGWRLNLQSALQPGAEGRKDPSKTKFTCSSCGWIIRGKPDTLVICARCHGLPEQPVMKAEGAFGRTVKVPDGILEATE